jgi:hypothetical protein
MNQAALVAHLRDCSLAAGAIPVHRLTRPRSLAALPEVVRQVEENFARAAEEQPARML